MDRTAIKILILEKNTSQTEIAQKIGIPVQTVCDILAGRKTTRKWQEAIAEVLGKSVDELFGNGDLHAKSN